MAGDIKAAWELMGIILYFPRGDQLQLHVRVTQVLAQFV